MGSKQRSYAVFNNPFKVNRVPHKLSTFYGEEKYSGWALDAYGRPADMKDPKICPEALEVYTIEAAERA